MRGKEELSIIYILCVSVHLNHNVLSHNKKKRHKLAMLNQYIYRKIQIYICYYIYILYIVITYKHISHKLYMLVIYTHYIYIYTQLYIYARTHICICVCVFVVIYKTYDAISTDIFGENTQDTINSCASGEGACRSRYETSYSLSSTFCTI